MTLPESGSITGAQIRSELRQSGGGLVFPDATTRYLSDRASGSITIPTHFYGKTAVKRTHAGLITGSSTSLSTTAGLGIDFPNRRLIVCVGVSAAGTASQLIINSVVLGGSSLFLGPGQGWLIGGSYNISSGIAIDVPHGVSGTSATLAVNCNQTITNARVVVYSVANIGNTFNTNQSGGTSNTSATTNIAIDTNGVVIASGLKTNNGGTGTNLNFSFVNEDTDIDMGNNIQYGTGFINRQGAQAGQSVSVSGTGSASICTIAVASFGS